MSRFAIVILVCALACKSSDDAKRAVAGANLCKDNVAALGGAPDVIKRESAVGACAIGCEDGDRASCTAVTAQVAEVCKLDRAWCDAQCNSDKTFEQVKKAACSSVKP